MSKVLIVSRTRMRENRVCVGGIDLDNNRPIRLLDPNGIMRLNQNVPLISVTFGNVVTFVIPKGLRRIWKTQM